ncbi:MCE family protein [Mycobacterium sp. CBMA293]|uniref:MlaD family protein n=1 Tax=unclassified Mycolicibacterium TaxID=2636767 RepID=UPI0012DDDCD2|nr:MULTISPECIES: MlaD family protein [unclassified Mycolicibacterium]MUL49456.1 MCE family protein [Mycolicibacterium sp. CBMA 360]MUL57236.1 MCE family protein [Mycolicibacterium sp. CBMA 335]MUL70276.1 MCE family protein [Mycolicibacterium sp. CBMA 311]MUL92324.1 MCE family protein [Mycolicibacterium sp. CBMA 230]MUM06745.1 mammalian cell entry protein [Mycolicibacterium sp. CBMA 213]
MKLLRNPTLWGAAALALMVVVSLVAAWLYVSPPRQKHVIFYTNDASSLHTGDAVRIAGINIGKVTDLVLEAQRVRVLARVNGDAFIGNNSQVDVRMLTVVGGYYVNIVSLGDKPLGDEPIPVERVKMPYNLMKALSDSTKLTEEVDTRSVKESLDQLQQGLSGNNIESLSAVVDAGNSIMSAIERQRGQLTKILNFSDEYIRAINNYGDELRSMVRKISLVEQTLVLYGENFGLGIEKFNTVLNQVSPLAYFYDAHREELLEKMRNWLEKARMWAEHNGTIIRAVRAMRNKMERVLDAQNAPPEFLATDLCMPVPGGQC